MHRADPSGEFKTFSEKLYRATFKEVSFPTLLWFHIHRALRSQMEQIKHPLSQPWVNAIPLMSMKLGGGQGFLDATTAIARVDWFNKTYPNIDTKMADDILKKDAQRIEGKILFLLNINVGFLYRHICLCN